MHSGPRTWAYWQDFLQMATSNNCVDTLSVPYCSLFSFPQQRNYISLPFLRPVDIPWQQADRLERR